MDNDSIIIKCLQCGTKNRIPRTRIDDQPRCGKCHTDLPALTIYDHPVDITDRTFQDEVISHPGVVLMDCWAPWCGPCKMISPVLEQLAKEYAGRVKIVKLNVDENQVTASQFAIQSIPTILLFNNGHKANTLVGALPKTEIEKHLKSLL